MAIVRALPTLRRLRPAREDAQPILKWAGGKTRLLDELVPRLPERMGRYFEPFFGGGALYFRVQPEGAVVSDVNRELVNVYEQVRDRVEDLVLALDRQPYSKEHYYRTRARDPESLPPLERAARTIYLNRTCFNGLYRVNRRGAFNVPIGSYKDPVICHPDRLRACSEVLRGAHLVAGDYRDVVEGARAGDFVYFDPPYQPLSATSSFTSYTAGAFGPDDQRDLADTVRRLGERGVSCMVSNSDTPLVRELYDGLRIEVVLCPRAISCDGGGRGPVREVVVRNW